MLKFSDKEVNKFSVELPFSKYYRLVYLRDNIEIQEDGRYSYNEYRIVLTGDSVIENTEEYVENNFDILLSQAKLSEKQKEIEEKISSLKKQLDNSDYKILKCVENFMLGYALPYDFSKLLSTRIGLRDNINLLESDNYEISIDELKDKKISEMCASNQSTITNGIDFNGKHYRLNTTDQINLSSLYSLASQGKDVPYHADGEVCSIFKAEDMCSLANTATKFIIYHTTYFNLLKHQILDMESKDEVNSVYYGMSLKDEYNTILSGIIGD